MSRMNRLKQEFRVRGFSVEVNGTSVFSSFQNSSIQSTDAHENRVSCFFELLYHLIFCEIPTVPVVRENLSTISSLSLGQVTSSVLERTAYQRNPSLSPRSRCNSDHLISTGCR